jgi:hypothetical protein
MFPSPSGVPGSAQAGLRGSSTVSLHCFGESLGFCTRYSSFVAYACSAVVRCLNVHGKTSKSAPNLSFPSVPDDSFGLDGQTGRRPSPASLGSLCKGVFRVAGPGCIAALARSRTPGGCFERGRRMCRARWILVSSP